MLLVDLIKVIVVVFINLLFLISMIGVCLIK